MMLQIRSFALCLVFVAASGVFARQTHAADTTSSEEKQRKLISVLQSDAQPGEKAIACKQLAIYGSKDAVPALAPLLADANLASWARIALEAIPGPAADEALREAMGKLQGRLLVGTINSIAIRHDPKAVEGLVKRLDDTDVEVASAAAVALGRIGGDLAADALEKALASAPAGVRGAVADGCVLCAERFLAYGKSAPAVKLYDLVRKADVPKQKTLNAIRGAILARESAGLPLLIEQLKSPDKALLGIGLRVARELPGRNVTEALAAEIKQAAPDRQGLLLLALADRTDAAVLPAVLDAAKSGSTHVRTVAAGVLQSSGNVTCVPVLLDSAVNADAELSAAAKLALATLPGKDVDTDLGARLPGTTGKTRKVLIELAGQRDIRGALPSIVKAADDSDKDISGAAVQALGAIGEDKQAADLVRILQKTQGSKERADIETALVALTGRCGVGCVPYLLPLAQSSDASLRTLGLHTLASVGGADALASVKAAINDKDESVQDEAVRTLSTWPNNWPDDAGVADALLDLAKSGKKVSHQVLGVRGYLQYVHGDKKLNDNERVGKIKDLLPLISRPEEKRLAIAATGALPTASALELLLGLTGDSAIAEDAYSAIVTLTAKSVPGVSDQQRQKALATVTEKSTNDALKKKADEALKKIR